jgi:hypothetical protein
MHAEIYEGIPKKLREKMKELYSMKMEYEGYTSQGLMDIESDAKINIINHYYEDIMGYWKQDFKAYITNLERHAIENRKEINNLRAREMLKIGPEK